jgi:hypothetical protein
MYSILSVGTGGLHAVERTIFGEIVQIKSVEESI